MLRRYLRKWTIATVASVAIVFAVDTSAVAQTHAHRRPKKPAPESPTNDTSSILKAKDDLIAAAQNYKETLQKLLAFQQDSVKTATEAVAKRKALLEQQIISQRELEDSQRQLAAAEAKVAETRRQMEETDSLIAETRGEAQLALLPPPRIGATYRSAALIRYNGPATWLLSEASRVESFFLAQFHHPLPISAFGQTAVHTQLGFDHSNSIDVALHPDSAEGQALMTYLRGQGIPFIAFRQAVPGSATGAHIHIGYPSHRIR